MAELAKEKTLFHGNNFFSAGLMMVLVAVFALYASTTRGKVSAEALRWQREAACEISQLEHERQTADWQ